MKLERTRNILRRAITANNPILLLSGGIDSILTLHLAREISKDIPVLTFTQDFNAEQMRGIKKLIFDFELTCYTFPPINRYFVPNGKETSIVDEYTLGGTVIPVIRDFEQTSECGLELSADRSNGVWFGWNNVLTGLRRGDRHSLTGKLAKSEQFEAGNLTFYAPLFEWTRREVKEAAKEFDLLKYVAAPDTGNLQKCSRCLDARSEEVFCPADNKMIPAHKWDREAMKNAFREKYGYGNSK